MGGTNMDGKDFERLATDVPSDTNGASDTSGTSDTNTTSDMNDSNDGCCGGSCCCRCNCEDDADTGDYSVGGLLVDIAKTITLNDFANCYLLFPDHLKNSFAKGDSQIWFKRNKNETISVDVNDLNKTHVLLGSIAEKSLYTIHLAMSLSGWLGGVFSPDSISGMFLSHKGTDHYAIEAGDVAVVDGNTFVLEPNGNWTKVS